MKDKLIARDGAHMGIITRPALIERAEAHGVYTMECLRADGSLRWRDRFDNLVTTVGKNDMLDKYLSGSAWTVGTIYMGFKGTGTPAITDTMASHASWSEITISSTRPSATFTTASAGSKTSNTFSVTVTPAGPTTVVGAFIVIGGTSAIGNTTGVLFSAGDIATARDVYASDVVNLTYTTSI